MGRAYSAGNLSFEFTGQSGSAVNSIDTLLTKLWELKSITSTMKLTALSTASTDLKEFITAIKSVSESSLDNIKNISDIFNEVNRSLSNIDYTKATQGFTTFVKSISAVALPLQNIGKRLASLKDITSAVNAIGRIPKIASNLNSLDFSQLEANFVKLTQSVKPFLSEIEKSKEAIVALSNVINKFGGGNTSTNKKGGLFGSNGLLKLMSLGTIIYSAKRLGYYLSQVVTYGSNYTETLNKWQVAMSNNVDYAREFVDKMNEAYGISRETLMDAQSTFKNMIGSLGQISEATAYNLSKGITQMAIDYSSLYNVQLEKAFSKFQAMLAGQVRPIRSDSGYDITETTLFQLYQSLGGEKSMRQLTRTEKQLLSILSVFKQMDRSGALGDMENTMKYFANQSRMLAENFKEFVTWIGISIQYLLQENEVLIKLNGILIVAAKVAQQFAKNIGYVDPDFAISWSENVEDTNLALDELNSKLLGFDKFRALNGSGEDNLAIDKVLEDAIAKYTSAFTGAENPAQTFADKIIEGFGGIEELTAKIERLTDVLINLALAIGLITTTNAIVNLVKKFGSLSEIFTSVNFKATVVVLAIGAIAQLIIYAVEAFKDGDYAAGIFASALATVVASVMLLKNSFSLLLAADAGKRGLGAVINVFSKGLPSSIALITVAVLALAGGIAYLVQNFDELGNVGKVLVPILAGVVGAIVALVVGTKLLVGNWVAALSIGAIVAGVGLVAFTELSKMMKFEQGGTIPRTDNGTIFMVGENRKTEAVYTAADGSTHVANVQQMKAAFYGALVEYGKNNSGANGETIIYIDGEPVFNAVQKTASKKGLAFAKKG